MARIVATGHSGVDPATMGIGPVPATRKALERAGLKVADLDVVEANEAFAAQACAVAKDLGFDPDKVNPNGSGISIGHPVGATGAMLTVKAMYEMARMGGRYGLVTMCIGGGQGIAAVLERARQLAMCVIHIKVGFRPGFPEVSLRNPLLAAIKNSSQHQKLFEGGSGAIHPDLGPRDGDIVITKHRVSAFRGTDLEMILRAKEIDTLILFGIATSGVVLSTLLEAADADYRVTVIKDCCADVDAELHSCLIDRFFSKRGTLISANDFLAAGS
jgi:nicotinamidase-related amidase